MSKNWLNQINIIKTNWIIMMYTEDTNYGYDAPILVGVTLWYIQEELKYKLTIKLR